MQRIAPHTRLKPGRQPEYDSVHQVIPAELDAARPAADPPPGVFWSELVAAGLLRPDAPVPTSRVGAR
ncbi:hypothetical protein O7626_18475 [Micromonospora sp. WMMD1102]|uniref:hypothetical protein n=1 Tax=Micromonospora sp. WMMD1102 TaxID=3016105 RepID=UPI0024157059|nr:hypothetical protein [Micromonospora sp. WMMD1102]MDG4787902.1 hypothetical protein [Micromonospora sp. WMMD1102]